MAGRRRRLPLAGLVAALLVATPACGAPGLNPTPEPAQLTAEKLRVTHQSKQAAAEELLAEVPREVRAEDRIAVLDTGEALLRFRDYLLVRIFHDSRLETGCDPTAAPAQCYRLEAGATFNTLTPDQAASQRLRIETDGGGVVIRNTGTRFLVAYDAAARLTWVVVAEGSARVSAAGQEVSVGAREQTWVEPGQPPVAPQPAARALVGGRFPSIDRLTGGAFSDSDLLPVPLATSTTTPAPAPSQTPTPTMTPRLSTLQTSTPTSTPRSASSGSPTSTTTPRPGSTATPTRPATAATPTLTTTRGLPPTSTPTPTSARASNPTPTNTPSPTARAGPAGSAAITVGHDVSSLAFAPNGRTLVAGGVGSQVTLWDVASRRLLRTLKEPSGGLSSVAFAPDGRLVAATHGDSAIGLWEAATGTRVRVIDGAPLVEDLAFAPDGKTLAAVSEGVVQLFEVVTGQRVRVYREAGWRASSIAFAPSGATLAAGMASDDSSDGLVLVWDVSTGKVLRTLRGHVLRVTGVAFAANGRRLASIGADTTVRVWDASTGATLATWEGNGQGVAISPDGTLVAAGGRDGEVTLWEVSTKRIRTLTGHTRPVGAVAFAPDGATLATGGGDDTIRLWDVSENR